VLGTVAVRSYLSRKEAVWWHEVRLTAGVLSFNIIMHTIVLFLLLKVRIEPPLSLRSTVAGLAKGVIDLPPRARANDAQTAEYQAFAQSLREGLVFAQSLREMALLEATMQSVAECGQRVLQRLTAGKASEVE
jgi:predicted dehydrogenase